MRERKLHINLVEAERHLRNRSHQHIEGTRPKGSLRFAEDIYLAVSDVLFGANVPVKGAGLGVQDKVEVLIPRRPRNNSADILSRTV